MAATPPHTWDVRLDDHDLTVILTGELDCLTAPALSAQLGHLLASHRPRRLVLDLAGVRFMDCAGLRPIVQARRALPADQPIVLRGPTGPVRRLLHIARTGEAWQIEDL